MIGSWNYLELPKREMKPNEVFTIQNLIMIILIKVMLKNVRKSTKTVFQSCLKLFGSLISSISFYLFALEPCNPFFTITYFNFQSIVLRRKFYNTMRRHFECLLKAGIVITNYCFPSFVRPVTE